MISIAILVALTMGITEVIKRTGLMNNKYMPVVAVVFALGFAFLTKHLGDEVEQIIIQGLIAGLTACGLYSSVKNVKEGLTKKEK